MEAGGFPDDCFNIRGPNTFFDLLTNKRDYLSNALPLSQMILMLILRESVPALIVLEMILQLLLRVNKFRSPEKAENSFMKGAMLIDKQQSLPSVSSSNLSRLIFNGRNIDFRKPEVSKLNF